MEAKTKLNVQTIKDFAVAKGFVSMASGVRVNENGYPFVTFINADNVAENIYFTKDAATKVVEGQAVDAQLIKQHQIVETKNAAGEIRFKLGGLGNGNGGRVMLEDLFSEDTQAAMTAIQEALAEVKA